METARFQYKCRLCGEIYQSICTSEEKAHTMLSCMVRNRPGYELHSDCKLGYGISDIIGYTVEENHCSCPPDTTLDIENLICQKCGNTRL